MNSLNTNIVLAILALIGIGTYMFAQNQQIKENFDGFTLSVQKVKEQSQNVKGGRATLSSVPLTDIPQVLGIQTQSKTTNPYQTKTPYAQAVVSPMGDSPVHTQRTQLGAGATTQLPFVSMPNFQQSVVQNRPDVQLSNWQYVAPPSRDTMGMAPNCNSNSRPHEVVEGYSPTTLDIGNGYPGSGFAASNYNQVAEYQPCVDGMNVGGAKKFSSSILTESGDAQLDTIVFDRYMVSTKQRGDRNSRVSGTVDFIRGDLAIVPHSNSSDSLFGYGTANPTSLTHGSVQSMPTSAEHNTLAKFTAAYGKTHSYDSSVGGGSHTTKSSVNMNNFQTLPQVIASTVEGAYGGGNTTAISF